MAVSFLLSHQGGVWRSACSVLGFALLALGCGASASESGTNTGEPNGFFPSEDKRPATPIADPKTPLVEPGAIAGLCEEAFTPCGGLLAGAWSVEDFCTEAPIERIVLQRWTQAAMGLDAEACADAVQTIDSRWGGDLSFDQGVAIDLRRRSDTAEVTLSRNCLSKTFDVDIRADQLGVACSTLNVDSRSCAMLGDGCQCTVHHERPAATPRVYGVIDQQVSIVDSEGGRDTFDYCVIGDRLQWQEPDTGQLLLLRRTSPAQ